MVSSNRASGMPRKLISISDGAKSSSVRRRPSLGNLLKGSKFNSQKLSKKQPAIVNGLEVERKNQETTLLRQKTDLSSLEDEEKPLSISYGDDEQFVSVAIIPSDTYSVATPIPIDSPCLTPATAITTKAPASITSTPDIYARTQSMAHRGRYSCTSTTCSVNNSIMRSRKRRCPASFNVLVIGAESSGKTSFLNFLKTSLALEKRTPRPTDLREDIFAPPYQKFGNFEKHYLETEIDGEGVGLTLWDSEGLKECVIDFQIREISSFLESKFEQTLTEETRVFRKPGSQDSHIHAVFLLLDPLRLKNSIARKKELLKTNSLPLKHGYSAHSTVGGLDEEFDLKVLRALHGKTTVIPIISKADTVTSAQMKYLKENVWESIRQANLDLLDALARDDTDSDLSESLSQVGETEKFDDSASKISWISPTDLQNRMHHLQLTSRRPSLESRCSMSRNENGPGYSEESPILPLSIISPDILDPSVIGRRFPWGLADPMNEEHCDFVHLKEDVFGNWRSDLRQASREVWYEHWRTSRLAGRHLRQ